MGESGFVHLNFFRHWVLPALSRYAKAFHFIFWVICYKGRQFLNCLVFIYLLNLCLPPSSCLPPSFSSFFSSLIKYLSNIFYASESVLSTRGAALIFCPQKDEKKYHKLNEKSGKSYEMKTNQVSGDQDGSILDLLFWEGSIWDETWIKP